MIIKVDKEKLEDKNINDNDERLNINNKFSTNLEENDEQNTFYHPGIPPKIPKSDLTSAKKPPINLRIHNTNVIEEKLPISDIVGLAFQQNILDENFRPKPNFNTKKFRKVWKWIHCNPSEDKIFVSKSKSSLTLAKIKNKEYYVLEGIRRVSALKHSKFEYIQTQVVDYTDIYNKILERKEKVKKLKSKSTKQIIKTNTSFKPKMLKFKPTPIKKDIK